MDEIQKAELERAVVIVSESLAKAAAALTEAMFIVAAGLSEMMDDICDHYEVDSADELLQAIERIKAMADMGNLADDLDDIIIPAKKLPRPPKRIGPANKANYTANRPKRMARSSLRVKAR